MPELFILVHTEEAFDWNSTFNRNSRDTKHVKSLGRYQALFESYEASVGYALTYPVVEQKESADNVRTLVDRYEHAYLGMHCHPWVTPPYNEEVNNQNSYPSNLPVELEREKIRTLYQAICEKFKSTPLFYLAGRYGIRRETYGILNELQIAIDFSPVPYYDYSNQDGPDFTSATTFESRVESVNVLPHSSGFVGWATAGGFPPKMLKSSLLRSLKITSLFSLTKGYSQVILTPEGFSLSEMISLTRALIESGHRYIVLSFHSSSIVAGNNPFVKTKADEITFYNKLERYLEFYSRLEAGYMRMPVSIGAEG